MAFHLVEQIRLKRLTKVCSHEVTNEIHWKTNTLGIKKALLDVDRRAFKLYDQ